jgi:hypothetical protein
VGPLVPAPRQMGRRLGGTGGRGEEGGLRELLTAGGDLWRRSDFREGRTGGEAWRPAWVPAAAVLR